VRKRKFLVATDSYHVRKIFRTWRARWCSPAMYQLWVAGITYIRLETEFIYLAVVIDAFSRRVIGWALTMEDNRAHSPDGCIIPTAASGFESWMKTLKLRGGVSARIPRSELGASLPGTVH